MIQRDVATILIYRDEEGDWIAHCLDFSLLAHGRRPKDAVKKLIGVITTHIDYLKENDLVDQLYDPAPPEYWKGLRSATPLGLYELKKVRSHGFPGRFPPIHEMARINVEYSRIQP